MINSEEDARGWIDTIAHGDSAAMERLELLVSMLVAENSRQNLVSRSSVDEVWQRHIADSLQLLKYVSRETTGEWLDLGSGAGFPGLAVAAVRPEWPVTLVESRVRRVEWLQTAAAALGLKHVSVIHNRLERIEARSFHIISARAFAPLPDLLDLAHRFSTKETLWLLPKGKSAAQELSSVSQWHHTFHVEQSITDAQAGIIVGNVIGRKGSRS